MSAIEAKALALHLAAHPDLISRLEALAVANPHAGGRCALLDGAGHCTVYDARPLICRSHGAPVAFRRAADGPWERDVCPLNFRDGLPDPGAGDHLNLETLNTILALLNEQAGGGSTRAPLTLEGLRKGLPMS